MKTPKPDEPCWCGSGQTYQKCHQAIDSVPADKRLYVARAIYSKMWERNAQHFETQECYDWMASLLEPYKPCRILDIGCGVGNGIVALLKRFPTAKIVSIDENSECIDLAQQRLEARNIPVSVIRRLKDEPTGPRSHRLGFESGKLISGDGVDLIESDVLIDEEFVSFLETQPKCDAVTVWLMGSHLLRYHECDNFDGKITSPGEYRLYVQNTAYRLADHVLKSGGVLQIVDRGEPPTSDLFKNDNLNSHREQATLTDGRMVVTSHDYRVYTEATDAKAIKMVVTAPTSGRIADTRQLAMISVISVKK
jgi:SAM-dependent methyltransferase